MAALTIREKVWKEFVALARRLRRKPEALAENVLRDYIQRVEDERLLADSERDARRAGLREEDDIEEMIREWRRKTRARGTNGSEKKANARGS